MMTNHPKGHKSSERQYFSGTISRGILSGGNYLWRNCPGAIIWGQLSRGNYLGAIFCGGNCPEYNYPGKNFPRGN